MNLPTRIKQVLSVILTLGIYSWVFNWKLSLIIVGAVAFHEWCHLLAAQYFKLNTNGFYIIPFVGGGALITEKSDTQLEQVIISIAGPLGGGISAGAFALVYYFTRLPFFSVTAFLIAAFNLFNCAPVSILDGAHVFRAVFYSINRTAGMIFLTLSTLAGVVALWFLNKMLFGLLTVVGIMEIWHEIVNWRTYRRGEYYLCSELYLHQPQAMNFGQGIMAISSWAILSGGLLILMRLMPFSSLDVILK